jgi:hypothetical protein
MSTGMAASNFELQNVSKTGVISTVRSSKFTPSEGELVPPKLAQRAKANQNLTPNDILNVRGVVYANRLVAWPKIGP